MSEATKSGEAMRWNGEKFGKDFGSLFDAETIIAWVLANGGEARYEPNFCERHGHPEVEPRCQTMTARIAVRTADGWAYCAPGDLVARSESGVFEVTRP